MGNSIKGKGIPDYIKSHLSVGIRLLLQGRGRDFIEEYYNYIEKIYNYQIPVREIASKGKVKKSLEQYKKDIKELTKAGRPKSRQAWYELAIKEGIEVGNGETIYYVNTGTSKSHADTKKLTHYYKNDDSGEKIEVTKDIEKEYKAFNKAQKGLPDYRKKTKIEWLNETHPEVWYEEEIILNCRLVPRSIIDSDEDVLCSDLEDGMFEYNCPKYIAMFNNKMKPLLVCFSKDIRNDILITDPKDRKYFTEEECQLVSGEPNNPSDQDTYEQLMTMEDKEIRFWTKYNMVPPFLEECGMGKWEDIVADYEERMKKEKELGIDKEKEELDKVMHSLTKQEVDDFLEDGTIPDAVLRVCVLDPKTFYLMSKKYPDIQIGSLNDIIDRSEEIKRMLELE